MKLEELLKQEFVEDAKIIAKSKSDFLSSDELSLTKFITSAKQYQKNNEEAYKALIEGEKNCISLRDQRLLNERNYNDRDCIYNIAKSNMAKGLYFLASVDFAKIKGHKDASSLYDQCEGILEEKYKKAEQYRKETNYPEAIKLYEELSGYKDSKELLRATLEDKNLFPKREDIYNRAVASMKQADYYHAYEDLSPLANIGFRDSVSLLGVCENKLSVVYSAGLDLMAKENYAEAKVKFVSLYDYRDSEKKVKECEQAIAKKEKAEKDKRDAELRAAERQAQMQRDKTERVVQTIIIFMPALLVLISAIIMFANSIQLRIAGTFTNSLTWWFVFLIATVICTIIFFKKLLRWEAHEKSARIVAGVFGGLSAFILVLMIIISAVNLDAGFNPATFMKVTVTGKSDTSVYFSVENTSKYTIDSFYGKMELYKQSSSIGTYNVTFNGQFAGGRTYNTEIDFRTENLYYTSFSELGVKFKITSFHANYEEFSVNGSTITLKSGGSGNGGGNNNNNSAINPTNPASTLQKLQAMAGQDAILPDNYEEILDEGPLSHYSSYDGKDHSSYYCFFIIPDSRVNSFLPDFIEKLASNGYYLQFEDYGEHWYVKNNTVLDFGNVIESTTYMTGTGEYRHDYWYLNFYGYPLN